MRERLQRGTLKLEGKNWILRYSERHADGTLQRPRVLIGTTEQYRTFAKARVKADEYMRGINEAAAVIRFEHLCDRYEREGLEHLKPYTRDQYRFVIRRLRSAFGKERLDWMVSAPGRAKIGKWLTNMTTLKGEPVSASFRGSVASHLGMIFNFAMENEHLAIGRNPIELVRYHNLPDKTAPARRHDVLTAEQYNALLNSPMLQPWHKVLIPLMELTGMRGCEAVALQWSDIDWKGTMRWADIDPTDRGTNSDQGQAPPRIFVHRSAKGKYIDETPKSSRSKRTVFMPDELASILHRWKAERPSVNGWLFGNPRNGKPLQSDSAQIVIKAAAAELGFAYEGFGLHANRHTFRRNLELAGATDEEQMWAMGHSTMSMTRRYGQDGFDKAARVAKVVSILSRKTGTENQ